MPEPRLVLNNPKELVIRMYGLGFGDCFLLALPRSVNGGAPDLNNPVYIVIDSGVYPRIPGESKRMKMVASSILEATGGNIDVLVASHEHYDHLCGFESAKTTWKQIGVRQVWAAWTENPNHPATQIYDHEQETLERQALAAQSRLAALAGSDRDLAEELAGTLGLVGFGSVRDTTNAASQDSMVGVAADLGFVLGQAPSRVSKVANDVLSDLTKHPQRRFSPAVQTTVVYCEPGQVHTVPGTDIDAYVLGPPTDANFLSTELVESEVYPPTQQGFALASGAPPSLEKVALAAAGTRAERQSLLAALERKDGQADAYTPFKESVRMAYDRGRDHPFFKTHYFDEDSNRQIENEWLYGSGQLALQLDNLTNNTSLVLALRLKDERVLLFVGDAQVGNWLSWHQLKPEKWARTDGTPLEFRPTAQMLLEKTAVYKVGHHGSHNATLKQHGLEMMPDGVIAFVPTSRKLPQINNDPPWDIPLPSLMSTLREKTRGNVVLPHDNNGFTSDEFGSRVERSGTKLPAMIRDGKSVEGAVPLWHQVRI